MQLSYEIEAAEQTIKDDKKSWWTTRTHPAANQTCPAILYIVPIQNAKKCE